MLKSALQIVAAERSIKNAAAATAARRHASASPDAAAPPAKRFAAAAPVAGGDDAGPARPVAKAPSRELSPRASSMSAAMNNGLYPTPSTASLQPASSAGSPFRGAGGGGLETQRSALPYGAASAAAASSSSAPALQDAIADVHALEVRHHLCNHTTQLICAQRACAAPSRSSDSERMTHTAAPARRLLLWTQNQRHQALQPVTIAPPLNTA